MTIGRFIQACSKEELVECAATLMAIGCDQLARLLGEELDRDMMDNLAVRFMNIAGAYLEADAEDLADRLGK